MICAVLPAAGLSLRMGRPKLALPLGEATVLEHVIAALRQAAVDPILVVVGPQVPQLVLLAEKAGAQALLLPTQTPDMRATVEAGLLWLEERLHPAKDDQWLLVPADHPTLDPDVLRQLISARAENPASSIVVPTNLGHRGHPTLMDWQHVAGIRTLPPGSGLNVYLRQHGSDTLEVPVESSSILCDLDTPEEYERLRHEFSRPIRLFVYGTLMRGGVRHAALQDQHFLGEVVTQPGYQLVDLGAYPGLVPAGEGGQAIHGELYEVDRGLIPRLDAMEGAPTLYRLERVEVEGETGPVFTYVYCQSIEGRPVCAVGRWENRLV